MRTTRKERWLLLQPHSGASLRQDVSTALNRVFPCPLRVYFRKEKQLKIKHLRMILSCLLQKMGVEPTRYCYHTDLNRARLPIPPLLQKLPE